MNVQLKPDAVEPDSYDALLNDQQCLINRIETLKAYYNSEMTVLAQDLIFVKDQLTKHHRNN